MRWVKSASGGLGGSFARNGDQIRHKFQLYDVTDTLRRRLNYNVGLSGLCFDFFDFWDFFKIWHAHTDVCSITISIEFVYVDQGVV